MFNCNEIDIGKIDGKHRCLTYRYLLEKDYYRCKLIENIDVQLQKEEERKTLMAMKNR